MRRARLQARVPRDETAEGFPQRACLALYAPQMVCSEKRAKEEWFAG